MATEQTQATTSYQPIKLTPLEHKAKREAQKENHWQQNIDQQRDRLRNQPDKLAKYEERLKKRQLKHLALYEAKKYHDTRVAEVSKENMLKGILYGVGTSFVETFGAEKMRARRLVKVMRENGVSITSNEFVKAAAKVAKRAETKAQRKSAIQASLNEVKKRGEAQERIRSLAGGKENIDRAVSQFGQQPIEKLCQALVAPRLRGETLTSEAQRAALQQIQEQFGDNPAIAGLSDEQILDAFNTIGDIMQERGVVGTDPRKLEAAFDAMIYKGKDAYRLEQLAKISRFDLITKAPYGKAVVLGTLGVTMAANFPVALAVGAGFTLVTSIHKLNIDRAMRAIESQRGQVNIRAKKDISAEHGALNKLFAISGNLMNVDWEQAGLGYGWDYANALIGRVGLGAVSSSIFFGLGRGFGAIGEAVHGHGASTHDTITSLAQGPGCFVAGTLILMADGSEKPIERVTIGEMVLSYNENSKEIQAQRVLALQSPVHTHLVELVFSNGKKTRNTPNHRYLTKEKGWASFDPGLTLKRDGVEAHRLEVGDIVFAYLDGVLTEVKIESITEITQEIQTFNLSNIENTHTFFANGIVVHNVKLGQTPGTSDTGAPSLTPASGDNPLQQLLDEGKKVLKNIQDATSSDKGHASPPGGTTVPTEVKVTPGEFSKDFSHFLGDKLDPKNPKSGQVLDDDLLRLRQEVNTINDPRLSRDFDTFVAHRASGSVTPNDIDQVMRDTEFLQVSPHVDAINTDIAGMRDALHHNDMKTYGKLLNDLQQKQLPALPPNERGSFEADIAKLSVPNPSAADLDKLQQDLSVLRTQASPDLHNPGDVRSIALEDYYNDQASHDQGGAYLGDELAITGNQFGDAFAHVGQTFDNIIGNKIHDILPGTGNPAEHAASTANSTISLPAGSHQVDIPGMSGVKVELPNGWTIDSHDHIFAMANGHSVDVGTLQQIQGHLELQPSNQLAAFLHLNSTHPIPLESLSGHEASLAEVGQYNPDQWHWDTQIFQPGLFSHNELTMTVDNGVVHYGGNLTGTNIPSHLDNIPIANDPNLQHIAAMSGGHIAPSDMVTAVRLNNGQVVLVPMDANGSAHLPPELFNNGQLQNLNYISTALVTDKDGHILHIGDLQHGLPEGAKIVSLASNPFQTPTTDAINHLNVTGASTGPQVIDLAKLIHSRVGEGGGPGSGGSGEGLPAVVGHFPGGAAGLAAAGVVALASIPAARNVYRARTGGGNLTRLQRGIAVLGFPGSLVAVGAAGVHNRRAGRAAGAATPAAAGATPAPVTTVTPPAAGTRLPAGLPASPNIYPAVSPQVANAAASLGANPHDRGAARQIAEQLHIPREQILQVAQAAETARNAHPAAGGGHHIEEAAGELVRNAPTGIDLKDANQARIMAGILFPNILGNVDRLNYTADAIRRAAVVQEAVVNNAGDLDAMVRDAIAGMEASSIDSTPSDSVHKVLQAIAIREVLMGQPGVLGSPAPSINDIRDAIIRGYEDAGADASARAIVAVATDSALRTPGYRVNEAGLRIQRAFEAANISFVGSPSTAAETAAVAQALVAAYSTIPNYLGNNQTANAENILNVLQNPVAPPAPGLGASSDVQGQVIPKMVTVPSQRRHLMRQAISGGTFTTACEVARGLKKGGMVARDIQREVTAVPGIVSRPSLEAVLAGVLADGSIEDQMKAAMQQIAADNRVTALAPAARGIEVALTIDSLRTVLAEPGTPVTLDQIKGALQTPELATLPTGVRQVLAVQIYDDSVTRGQTAEEAVRFALTASGLPAYGAGGYTDEQISTYYSIVSHLHSTRTGPPPRANLDTAEIAIREFSLDVPARAVIAARKLAIDITASSPIPPVNALRDNLIGIVTDHTTPEDLVVITQAMVAGVRTLPQWTTSVGARTSGGINTLCTTVGFGSDDRERRAVMLGAFSTGNSAQILYELGITNASVHTNPEYAAEAARGLILSRTTQADIRSVRIALSTAVNDVDRPHVAEQAFDLLSATNPLEALNLAIVASGVAASTPDDVIESVVAQLHTQGVDYDKIRSAMSAVDFPQPKRESLLGTAIASIGLPNPATRTEIKDAISRALAVAGCPDKITSNIDRNRTITAIRHAMPLFATGSTALAALNKELSALRLQLT